MKERGLSVGVYASSVMWHEVTCNAKFNHAPPELWYAHYDNNPSFSDFQRFGSWSKPFMKQYRGGGGLCGANVDLDFM